MLWAINAALRLVRGDGDTVGLVLTCLCVVLSVVNAFGRFRCMLRINAEGVQY